jgi:hypothetical protein
MSLEDKLDLILEQQAVILERLQPVQPVPLGVIPVRQFIEVTGGLTIG